MFNWQERNGGWVAEMPHNVTCVVMPERFAKGFTPKPARGTQWSAQCSHWHEPTRCMSRYGRDEYCNKQDSAREAMKLAESIYLEAADNPPEYDYYD